MPTQGDTDPREAASALRLYVELTRAPVRASELERLAEALAGYLDGLRGLDELDVVESGVDVRFDPRW